MPGGWRAREAMPGAAGANPPNPRSFPGPCYTCYMCYISQGKPLNIHSPPGPCYMCYTGISLFRRGFQNGLYST